MNKILIAIFCLFFSTISLYAQDAKSPLEAGNYLLVYQFDKVDGMRSLKVSFTKGTDGTLTVACADTSYLATTAIQTQSIFQFGLTKPGHREESRGTEEPFESLNFVGRSKLVITDQNEYKQVPGECAGTVAGITASQQTGSDVNGAGSGTFMLFKLP